MSETAKIGDDIYEPHPTVFELVLKDHIDFINPAEYNLTERSLNPIDYFVTSGDAVEKAIVLEKDLRLLAGELRRKLYSLLAKEHDCEAIQAREMFNKGVIPSNPPEFYTYANEVLKTVGQAKTLLDQLRKAKGTNCFLETEWEDHRLLCIPKNPRARE